MDLFQRDQINYIRRDIKKLKEHEEMLTKLFHIQYEDEIAGIIDNPMSLQEYIDSDKIVLDLIDKIKRRMDYNRFTIQALYRKTLFKEDITSIKEPVISEYV